jgi:hypothetical protein
MKRKIFWLLVAVAAGVALGYWFNRPAVPSASPAPREAKAKAIPPTPAEPVAIQDRKTIDFSSGRPVVKDSAQDRAIIDAAVKEMDEAAKNVRFDPTTPPPPAKKSPEPTGPQPKK